MNTIEFSQPIKHSKINVFCNVCDGDFTETIYSTLQSLNITKLCELQEYLVPAIMEKKYDIFIESPKGTGKTFGYILPIVNYISKVHESNDFEDNGNPFAIILMNDIEMCKKVSSEITRLYSGAKVIRIIGSEKEVNFIKEINNGCDIIVGSIIKFFKIFQPINFPLINIDILKVKFLVIDECEKFISKYWETYLNTICNDTFKKQTSNQIKIFSTCGLENCSAEMFMEKYAQKDYVIMKFFNKISINKEKLVTTFPIISENCPSNYFPKENLNGENSQNSTKHHGIIFSPSHNNIVVNNYTNHQQFTSNQSYKNHLSFPIRNPFYIHNDDSLRSNCVINKSCNVRYNPFRAQIVNPYLTVSPQHILKFGFASNFQYQQNTSPENQNNFHQTDDFKNTGLVKQLDIIEINLFDGYKTLLTVVKHLFNEKNCYKIIVFVTTAEGCNFGSNLCNKNGIQSKMITKNLNICETKANLEYFKSNKNVVLFVEDNYKYSQMDGIHSHVVISLNISETKISFDNKVKYLCDNDNQGGIFIIIGFSKIILQEWIVKEYNFFNVKD